MGHTQVEYKGEWATFSSIVGAFITTFSSEEEHNQWMLEEYGRRGFKPISELKEYRKRCIQTMAEAIFSTTLNRNLEDSLKTLTDIGIEENEAIQLIKEHGAYNPKYSHDDDNPHVESYASLYKGG